MISKLAGNVSVEQESSSFGDVQTFGPLWLGKQSQSQAHVSG